MEETTIALDRIIQGLRSGNADYSSELCGIDDYKILISLNNVVFYDVKGNYNAVGERCIVNSGSISGDNSLNACSLSDQQKILLEAYDRLDIIGQARLITYADKLCRKGGEVA